MDAPVGMKRRLGGTWKRCKLGQARFTTWLRDKATKLSPSENGQGRSKPKSDNSRNNPSTARRSELQRAAQKVAADFEEDFVDLRERGANFFRSAFSKSRDSRLSSRDQAHREQVAGVLDRILEKIENLVDKDASRNSEEWQNKHVNENRPAVFVDDMSLLRYHTRVFGVNVPRSDKELGLDDTSDEDDGGDYDDAKSQMTKVSAKSRKSQKSGQSKTSKSNTRPNTSKSTARPKTSGTTYAFFPHGSPFFSSGSWRGNYVLLD